MYRQRGEDDHEAERAEHGPDHLLIETQGYHGMFCRIVIAFSPLSVGHSLCPRNMKQGFGCFTRGLFKRPIRSPAMTMKQCA